MFICHKTYILKSNLMMFVTKCIFLSYISTTLVFTMVRNVYSCDLVIFVVYELENIKTAIQFFPSVFFEWTILSSIIVLSILTLILWTQWSWFSIYVKYIMFVLLQSRFFKRSHGFYGKAMYSLPISYLFNITKVVCVKILLCYIHEIPNNVSVYCR